MRKGPFGSQSLLSLRRLSCEGLCIFLDSIAYSGGNREQYRKQYVDRYKRTASLAVEQNLLNLVRVRAKEKLKAIKQAEVDSWKSRKYEAYVEVSDDDQGVKTEPDEGDD